MSTLKEPYRIEGKKTMAYELGEQMGWTFPDWIIYPTGGGTGMVGMWKAFEEMERIGWKTTAERPQMVSVQAEHCAPIVRAFEQGDERSEMWQNARTVADGLRVPKAVGDFLVLRAVRESGGTALAVTDEDMVARRCASSVRARGHQRRSGRRRRAARGQGPARATAGSSPTTPSSCSIPAARSNTSDNHVLRPTSDVRRPTSDVLRATCDVRCARPASGPLSPRTDGADPCRSEATLIRGV